MGAEEERKGLIVAAERALTDLSESRTEYNRNALRYILERSKSAMSGARLFPISGSRVFSGLSGRRNYNI